MWTVGGIDRIKNIKKSILKKKIMLGFIIDSYAWLDKIYRWTHNGLAVLTPILIIAQTTMNDTNGEKKENGVSGTIATIFGFIVAGMLKLKDYVTYDKIRDTAKMQTIKYQQLFERIENESLKPEDKRQSESDFIYWLGREFQHIEVNDPDLTNSEKKKFIKLCKEKNIPYDEDLELLNKLSQDTQIPQKIMDDKTRNVNVNVDINLEEKEENPHTNANIDNTNTNTNNSINNQVHNNSTLQLSPQESAGNSTINIITEVPALTRKSSKRNVTFDESRSRSNSEEETRKRYKESLKNMDIKADIKWTMERLNNL